MRAMIFAAGLGTRLKPITDTMPKALVSVAGKPLLYHVITRLKEAGITDFVINVHHFAPQILEYLREENDFGVNIAVSDETDLLRETGGGIRHARRFLLENETGNVAPESFLVHNVDILSNLDIRRFETQMVPGSLASILVSERKTQRYFLFDPLMRLVGWTNVATGEVRTPFKGLDVASCRKLAFAGIHQISTKIFDVFDELGFNEEVFSIVDFYLKAAESHPIYGIVQDGLELMDVGKIDQLDKAGQWIEDNSRKG